MELVYFPQNQYMIEGFPASKYGEWPGLKSNKWKGSIRVLRPKTDEKIFDGKSYEIFKIA